jgi:hypothetical protein
MSMKITISWDVTPRSLVEVYTCLPASSGSESKPSKLQYSLLQSHKWKPGILPSLRLAVISVEMINNLYRQLKVMQVRVCRVKLLSYMPES